MKSPRKLRPKISSIATGRWAAYAAAATATGFAASMAEATIHYSGPINHKFKSYRKVSFPLDAAGASLVLKHWNHVYGSSSFHDGGTASFFVYAALSGNVNGLTTARGYVSVSNLNRGNAISARPFAPDGGFLAELFGSTGFPKGQFIARQRNAFVGFEFNNGAGVQYGWARLKMGGSPFNNFELLDYAYGDPGDTIVAGQTSEGTAPTLESLGGLALGATALIAWRRRRRGA